LTKGLFIVLEGVEGAGKTTQARLLSEWLESLGMVHTLAREPGGTPVGEAIRCVVLDRGRLTMPPETELFLILGARAAFSREVVRPALESGQIVLADRFDLSTFAYQGFGRGLDLDQVKRANEMATGGLSPDIYLVLDLPVEVGMERKGGIASGDRIEREGAAFLSRVMEGYRALADQVPSARLVSAAGSRAEVQASIRMVLTEVFPETFPAGRV
jgi:dTMP kinase